METIINFIETKLKLKVNRTKSKVSRPNESTLLGFSFFQKDGKWETRIAPKSLKRIKDKIKAKTQRNASGKVRDKIKKMQAIIMGWVNYFAIAKGRSRMDELDGFTRAGLRIGIWKQWKNARTRIRHLMQLGINRDKAYKSGYSRKGLCRLAHSHVLHIALSKEWFRRQRYIGFADYYHWKTEHQTKLF
jgi:RNA-directed DNA polymerase